MNISVSHESSGDELFSDFKTSANCQNCYDAEKRIKSFQKIKDIVIVIERPNFINRNLRPELRFR